MLHHSSCVFRMGRSTTYHEMAIVCCGGDPQIGTKPNRTSCWFTQPWNTGSLKPTIGYPKWWCHVASEDMVIFWVDLPFFEWSFSMAMVVCQWNTCTACVSFCRERHPCHPCHYANFYSGWIVWWRHQMCHGRWFYNINCSFWMLTSGQVRINMESPIEGIIMYIIYIYNIYIYNIYIYIYTCKNVRKTSLLSSSMRR